MLHSQHALGRQISHSTSYQVDVGQLFLMLHEALDLFSGTCYQPPHWDHEPTDEDLKYESQYQQETEEAAEELEAVARDIFQALTGKKVIQVG